MPFSITIEIAGEAVPAELNDSDTALAIVEALPIESDFNTWGDEIYFSIPIAMGLENGRAFVQAGDIGYWPPGNAFCIFYGATPGSTEDKIRPASPVNIVGRVNGDPKRFCKLATKRPHIRIEKA